MGWHQHDLRHGDARLDEPGGGARRVDGHTARLFAGRGDVRAGRAGRVVWAAPGQGRRTYAEQG